jgi:hypothetical protein
LCNGLVWISFWPTITENPENLDKFMSRNVDLIDHVCKIWKCPLWFCRRNAQKTIRRGLDLDALTHSYYSSGGGAVYLWRRYGRIWFRRPSTKQVSTLRTIILSSIHSHMNSSQIRSRRRIRIMTRITSNRWTSLKIIK